MTTVFGSESFKPTSETPRRGRQRLHGRDFVRTIKIDLTFDHVTHVLDWQDLDQIEFVASGGGITNDHVENAGWFSMDDLVFLIGRRIIRRSGPLRRPVPTLSTSTEAGLSLSLGPEA